MNKPLVFTLFAAIILQGCIHQYYIPNVQNVPLFTEKGEFQFSGQIGTGEFSSSFEMQTALALTNNLGFAANYMYNKDENLNKDYTKGNYVEAAIGYFQPVNKNGVFEIYGGFGGGRQHHQYKQTEIDFEGINNYYNTADLSYTKLYLQPAWGYHFNICELALSTRFSSLSFNDVTTDLNKDQSAYNDVFSLTGQKHYFIEPAITFRIGLENIKAQLQYIYSGYLNSNHLDLFEQQHFSIGFVFCVNKKDQQQLPKE